MSKLKLLFSLAVSKVGRFVLSLLLPILPIKKNRVLFVSFRGKQYSCNPKYISDALEGDSSIERVWAFHQPEKFAQLSQQGIRVIGDRGWQFIKYALTAKVVVTNTYYKPFLPRRCRQFYLRTWHGGGSYKRVNYPTGLMGSYIKMQQEGADLYLSSSAAFTKETLREAFGYEGKVLEKGMPRNDMMVNGTWYGVSAQLRKELNLGGKKIALYAPTYRDDGRIGFGLDTKMVLSALKKRFGGDWILLNRSHHVLEGKSFSDVNDVTGYPDMQPLLAAADVLITDYSSCMWDMSLTFKPVFLYCTDLADFKGERDFFSDIHTWPFPLAEDNKQLSTNIEQFDFEAYHKAVARHHVALGSYESGQAAQSCADIIGAICKGKHAFGNK